MTVKVVRGLVGSNKPTGTAKINHTEGSARLTLAARASSSNPVANDAAVNSLRSTRSTQQTEKIKDSKEARGVAEGVAQSIFMDGETAAAAHSGLSSNSARGIL